MENINDQTPPMKMRMKGIFLTRDGGKTWTCTKTLYTVDNDGNFLAIGYQGKLFEITGNAPVRRDPWEK